MTIMDNTPRVVLKHHILIHIEKNFQVLFDVDHEMNLETEIRGAYKAMLKEEELIELIDVFEKHRGD